MNFDCLRIGASPVALRWTTTATKTKTKTPVCNFFKKRKKKCLIDSQNRIWLIHERVRTHLYEWNLVTQQPLPSLQYLSALSYVSLLDSLQILQFCGGFFFFFFFPFFSFLFRCVIFIPINKRWRTRVVILIPINKPWRSRMVALAVFATRRSTSCSRPEAYWVGFRPYLGLAQFYLMLNNFFKFF